MSTGHPTIRSLGPTVYLPTFLFAVGQGAVIPIIALTVRELGGSVALAGTAVALQGIGRMLFNIPAGELIERLGERRAMVAGTAILLVALVGCVLSPSPLPFSICVFVMGCGWSVWLLARLSYVSDVMPFHLRGRALSTLGGFNRIGNFVGPLLGAAVIARTGLDGGYHVHLVLAVLGLVALLVVRDPHSPTQPPPSAERQRSSFVTITRDHARVFATAGFGATTLSMLRASRHAVLPLWGAHIGLDPAAVSLVFGLSAAMDMTLFYPAGAVSDRFGRKAVAVPCLTILSIAFALLPLSRTFGQLVAVGVLMGLGNGMGSGIVMTLGADFAPPRARAAFLGVWRMVSDVGAAGGPLAFGAIAGAATLAAGSVTIGVVGLAGAAMILVALPVPDHGEVPVDAGDPPAPDRAAS